MHDLKIILTIQSYNTTRWDIISGSVDDRTRGERGLEPAATRDKFVIPKSRYDSIDSYLSCCADKWKGYNDIPVLYDQAIYDKLVEGGVDKLMAQHVAHLFIRDSVSMFRNKIREDGSYEDEDVDHFENIQSTNWQTMRFKPPPPGDKIGWRVEFRLESVQQVIIQECHKMNVLVQAV